MNPDSKEIKAHAIYTTQEAERLLKVSNSTIKRLLKRGILRANKVGRQYRILGKEILRMLSPEAEQRAIKSYLKLKSNVVDTINKW